MSKGKIALVSFALLTVSGLVGLSGVSAAEFSGTEKLAMNAEVLSVDGTSVTIKDTQTGEIYKTSFGPVRFSREYKAGEILQVEGMSTDHENERNHNFQTIKVGELELRSEFGGRPNWARSNGDSLGKHRAGGQANFIDADGDGNCDNRN